MKEILQDLFHAGIGLTRLKKEDIDKVFNELKSRGEVEEADREYFISSAVEKLEKRGKELSEKIMSTVNPNIERLKELNAKVDELIKEIDALKKKKT
jgi:polyhydroxyalkanoate synthesis regulator phasin